MNEKEFKQAINTAIKEVFDDIWGPIDFHLLKGSADIKFAPPQLYRGCDVSTYSKLLEHIGNIYVNGTRNRWAPSMGDVVKYPYGSCRYNFPQKINHPCGTMAFGSAKEMTVRNMGWLVFAIDAKPYWLDGLLVFLTRKYKNIMTDMPKMLSEEQFTKLAQWREPSPELVSVIGPTDTVYVEFWRLLTKARYDQHNAGITAQASAIKRQLAELGNETIAFLEQVPCEPKYGAATNCADVPIMAIMQ